MHIVAVARQQYRIDQAVAAVKNVESSVRRLLAQLDSWPAVLPVRSEGMQRGRMTTNPTQVLGSQRRVLFFLMGGKSFLTNKTAPGEPQKLKSDSIRIHLDLQKLAPLLR